MDYEFLVRTADNVEIILDVSIFWQITDLYKLVLVTQDPPEDICKFNYLIEVIVLRVYHLKFIVFTSVSLRKYWESFVYICTIKFIFEAHSSCLY